MPKRSTTDWKIARMEWEATPGRSFADVARALGVAAPTVFLRAQRECWAKLVPELPAGEMAQVRADANQALVEQATEVLERETAATLDFSVAVRVRVVNRQREDWEKHRRLFPVESMAGDPVCAKRAKLSAEAIALRQRGEAIAYGMVSFTGTDTGAPLVEPIPEDAKPKSALDQALEHLLLTGELPTRPLLENGNG